MNLRLIKLSICFILTILLLSTVLFSSANNKTSTRNFSTNQNVVNTLLQEQEEESDPPEIAIGERLFLETRFAHFFFVNSQGDVNKVLDNGDPILEFTETLDEPLPGAFAGQSINCRTCHMVDEFSDVKAAGNRSYSDFARRTLVPIRQDNKGRTVRNSPPLVNSSIARKVGFFLHFDGEFTSTEDLVIGTFIGRNFGWLANEKSLAIAHIANVIRKDNGSGDLAKEFGGAYKVVLKGTDPNIPEEFLLPKEFRIDVDKASDKEILNAIAKLVAAYVDSLLFIQDENGEFDGSPYDLFLKKNNLPRKPAQGETDLAYSRRLLQLLNNLSNPQFVSSQDGEFETHNQDFVFGKEELAGLKIFLTEANSPLSPAQIANGKIGNCVVCHTAPNFTDFLFHNTGESQEEYDSIFGEGEFAKISIPNLKTRKANYDAFLPPTENHPNAQGPFQDIPSKSNPGHTDLGLWNIFANPDIAKPQKLLKKVLCDKPPCKKDELLIKSIARFKTPGLRDLGHSAPYFHTGRKETLTDVVRFYDKIGDQARKNLVRNGAPELNAIALNPEDLDLVVTFLKSLNEDYE
jgi:cytochrome c peroxidase